LSDRVPKDAMKAPSVSKYTRGFPVSIGIVRQVFVMWASPGFAAWTKTVSGACWVEPAHIDDLARLLGHLVKGVIERLCVLVCRIRIAGSSRVQDRDRELQ